ncbi:hypothetical protein HYALB_00008451 [Hymenoscyphus albidus]|uniref:Uncharacterized protein n=1 Tax=Hymenoscyphus albidus TaxID=595503 RepID=A0A9N9LJQ9_9HELO|nr:hypothetical protein HYALB_00008451 [Hymenoscyphus albidus]
MSPEAPENSEKDTNVLVTPKVVDSELDKTSNSNRVYKAAKKIMEKRGMQDPPRNIEKTRQNTLKKRPHAAALLGKLKRVVEEDLKENSQEDNVSGSPKVLSWVESTHVDMENEEERKVTEFSLKFEFTSST